jgi:hypothetical protein
MCTELVLATLYFLTIFVVNVFLYKLVRVYLKNIFSLIQLTNIFKKFDRRFIKPIAIFYFYSKNEFQNPNLFRTLERFSESEDLLIIGKTYNYVADNLDRKSNKQTALLYYLRLLENQYLPKKKNE